MENYATRAISLKMQCLKLRRNFICQKTKFQTKKKTFITLPYDENLNRVSKLIKDNSNTKIAFPYENSIKSKVFKMKKWEHML